MTEDEAHAINQERLGRWGEYLAENKATAQITIGVGHDEHGGEIYLCAPDEPMMSKRVIAGFLRYALEVLEAAPGVKAEMEG